MVLIGWFMIADGILGLKRSFDMKRLADERTVHAFLAEHVTEPGRYVCNPEVLPGQRFRGDAPIFAVHYSGDSTVCLGVPRGRNLRTSSSNLEARGPHIHPDHEPESTRDV